MTTLTNTGMQRRTALAFMLSAAMASIAVAGSGAALAADPVDMVVVDRETNQPLDLYSHQGRRFVAGRTGARYALRVRNNTARRVLVVVSVDGVNICTGETAAPHQAGYILYPGVSYDLTGWRKSREEVAAFVFSPLSSSYAALTGRPSDVGVIQMAVIEERAQPPVASRRTPNAGYATALPVEVIGREELEARGNPAIEALIRELSESGAFQSQSSRGTNADGYGVVAAPQRRDERLGTGHGAIERSFSALEPFERASTQPIFVTRINYDTRENLIASGAITPMRYVPDPPRPR